jgi:hypothetical protein
MAAADTAWAAGVHCRRAWADGRPPAAASLLCSGGCRSIRGGQCRPDAPARRRRWPDSGLRLLPWPPIPDTGRSRASAGRRSGYCMRRHRAIQRSGRAAASLRRGHPPDCGSAALAGVAGQESRPTTVQYATVKVDVAVADSLPEPVTLRKYEPAGQSLRLTWARTDHKDDGHQGHGGSHRILQQLKPHIVRTQPAGCDARADDRRQEEGGSDELGDELPEGGLIAPRLSHTPPVRSPPKTLLQLETHRR